MNQTDAVDRLRSLFPKDGPCHTIVRHVSQSGMTRSISVVAPQGLDISDVSYMVALAIGAKVDKHGGVKRVGCGMDMCFDLVHTLARVLYGDGYALRHRHL